MLRKLVSAVLLSLLTAATQISTSRYAFQTISSQVPNEGEELTPTNLTRSSPVRNQTLLTGLGGARKEERPPSTLLTQPTTEEEHEKEEEEVPSPVRNQTLSTKAEEHVTGEEDQEKEEPHDTPAPEEENEDENEQPHDAPDVQQPPRQRHSQVEDSKYQEDFLVLHNVCLQRAPQTRDTMLFFAPTAEDQEKVTNSVNLYKHYYRPHTAWATNIKPPLAPALEQVEATLVVNTTMEDYMHKTQNSTVASGGQFTYLNGTTVVAEPHHPDNMFHLYNDMILGILYKVLKSNSQHVHPLRLHVTHGLSDLYNNRALGFDVLYGLFDEVQYPFERLLAPMDIQSNPAYTGSSVCFERLIWGGKLEPYYHQVGRFGLKDKWEGVLPQIRDWVNQAHGVQLPSKVSGLLVSNTNATKPNKHNKKPTLTWIDRPCPRKDHRCFHNTNKFLGRYLSKHFDIQTLSFDRQQNRTLQLKMMLQVMANTDVLMGMHGAGLAHAIYLQPHAILVEIIPSSHHQEKKLFLNMASHQDIGYYRYNPGAAASNRGVTLSITQMAQFARDLWAVWNKEVAYHSLQESQQHLQAGSNATAVLAEPRTTDRQDCSFPRRSSGLSSFDLSRCYLEQDRSFRARGRTQSCKEPVKLSKHELAQCHAEQERSRNGTWFQCSDFGNCNAPMGSHLVW